MSAQIIVYSLIWLHIKEKFMSTQITSCQDGTLNMLASSNRNNWKNVLIRIEELCLEDVSPAPYIMTYDRVLFNFKIAVYLPTGNLCLKESTVQFMR